MQEAFIGPLCRERSKSFMALQRYGQKWNLLGYDCFPLDLLGAVAAILQDKFGYVVT